MPVYDGINGVVRKRKEWPVGIGGVVRQQKEHWAGIDGVKRQIFSLITDPKVTITGVGFAGESLAAYVVIGGAAYYNPTEKTLPVGTQVTAYGYRNSSEPYSGIWVNGQLASTVYGRQTYTFSITKDTTIELEFSAGSPAFMRGYVNITY